MDDRSAMGRSVGAGAPTPVGPSAIVVGQQDADLSTRPGGSTSPTDPGVGSPSIVTDAAAGEQGVGGDGLATRSNAQNSPSAF